MYFLCRNRSHKTFCSLTCEPAYDVLLLMTTLCILPNFPKYSGRFKTYKKKKRKLEKYIGKLTAIHMGLFLSFVWVLNETHIFPTNKTNRCSFLFQ